MRARIARRGGRPPALAPSGRAGFEGRRESARCRGDGDRVVATMEVRRADRAFLLHVGDLTVGVDVLIAADDAAAIECGETEETDDAHTTILAVGSPTGAASIQRIAASRPDAKPVLGVNASSGPAPVWSNGRQSRASCEAGLVLLQRLRVRFSHKVWPRAKKRHLCLYVKMDLQTMSMNRHCVKWGRKSDSRMSSRSDKQAVALASRRRGRARTAAVAHSPAGSGTVCALDPAVPTGVGPFAGAATRNPSGNRQGPVETKADGIGSLAWGVGMPSRAAKGAGGHLDCDRSAS
jgi:hypothetical protein